MRRAHTEAKMRFIAFIFACLLLPSLLSAQPLADRIPNDALFYVGWSGSQNLGPAYEGSHLKGVIDASDFPKLFNEFFPRLAQRIGRDNPAGGEFASLAAGVGARLWRPPSAFYWGGMDFTDPRHPMPRIAILCDAGDEAAALTKDLQTAIDRAGKTPTPMKIVNDGTLVVVTIGTGVTAPAGKNGGNLLADAGFKSVMAQLHDKSLAPADVNAAG